MSLLYVMMVDRWHVRYVPVIAVSLNHACDAARKVVPGKVLKVMTPDEMEATDENWCASECFAGKAVPYA